MARSHLLLAAATVLWLPPAAPAETNAWAGSWSCRQCHAKFYQLWSTSFHGLAMQPYTADLAKAQLRPQEQPIVAGKLQFRADLQKGVVLEQATNRTAVYPIVQMMGGKNVFYFLTPLERGWLQVLPVAYDVRRQEWFDTTASAMRHFGDRRDEALYWKDRPLTFNTSCFSCHVSQLAKNYDLPSDSYHTTWAEPGINCETCHGPSAAHARWFKQALADAPRPADLKLIAARQLTIQQRNDLCAACHAKMSPLTANFAPGERFFDHFDLVAFENPDFYADGRDLGENYTFTLWRLSACVKSGQLDCLHCHTSSGRYRFREAAAANDACLPCHEAKVKNAPAHTHHKAGTAGNQCVNCHMPMTEFARMRRTDHSMRPPVPGASLAYQSPNACNLCHTNQAAAWADERVRQWHPHDFQQPFLQRAALIAAARKQDWTSLPAMLSYLSSPAREEVQAVSLLRLLANCADERKSPVLRAVINDPSPWVRASVVEAFGEDLSPANVAALLHLIRDESRLVRVRAAAALADVAEEQVPAEARVQLRQATDELLDSMRSRPDDMASHYNLGNFHFGRAQMAEALAEFQTAIRLQPDAVAPHVNAALVYSALNQPGRAEASLRAALKLDSTNAVANLNLGMLLGELGKLAEAEQAFRAAFKADPHSAQAAYNLGVLLSKDRPEEALTWCQRAAELGPANPKYGYTYAFYLNQAGRRDAALQVIRQVRERFPADENCQQLEAGLLRAPR